MADLLLFVNGIGGADTNLFYSGHLAILLAEGTVDREVHIVSFRCVIAVGESAE